MPRLRVLVALADRVTRQAVLRVVGAELPADSREALTGPEGYDAATLWLPDLVVVGTELPGFDGLQLCHRLRGIDLLQDVPIVAIGPRGDQARKYQAFYVGVNDYIELPFDGVELAYRLKALLRGKLRRDTPFDSGALKLEPATRTARLDGREAVLTPSEFAVLRVLAAQAGTPVPAERLLSEGLNRPARLANPQLIHTHIRNLRKKLEPDPSTPRWLLRHPAGYLLAAT